MRLRRSSSLSSVSTSTLLPRILRILVMCVSLSSLLSTTTPVFWHSSPSSCSSAKHQNTIPTSSLSGSGAKSLRLFACISRAIVLMYPVSCCTLLRSWAVFTLDLRGLRGAINFECVELITLFVGIFDVQPLLHFREGRGRLHYLPRL
ncbi:hypothetical protein KC332_g61 [Hortaea werneckii]|nr:hypothetical protein KC332_g61 [Hortaea werneckii]